MTIIMIVIKLLIIKIEENEYDSESDNEFLNERKLKYINKKRSHSVTKLIMLWFGFY